MSITKPFYAIALNFLLTMILFSVLRKLVHIPHQAFIDFAILGVCSTAHFWYMTGAQWRVEILIMIASVVVNVAGMITYVMAILRDSL